MLRYNDFPMLHLLYIKDEVTLKRKREIIYDTNTY